MSLLHAIESGSGDSVVALLHGMTGSAESWWRVMPLLVEQGYRVIALDLPGHGLSGSDPNATVDSAADGVIDTLHALAPGARISGMGHSYGGTVLGSVAARLPLELAVYVDTVCAFAGGHDRAELTAQYEADRERRRSADWLRASRPFYSAEDAVVEARAADRFDPATAASISCGADVDCSPGDGAIVVRADPSNFVTDEDAVRLASRGAHVRSVPGAAHTVWYSHFDEFVSSVPELFGER